MQLEQDVNSLVLYFQLCTGACMVCGKAFAYSEELELHGMRVHNSDKEECMLLRKAGEEEKARKRYRGPYRKSHTA